MGQCAITLTLSPKFPQYHQHIILWHYFSYLTKIISRFLNGSHLKTLLQPIDQILKKGFGASISHFVLGDPATQKLQSLQVKFGHSFSLSGAKGLLPTAFPNPARC